MSKNGIDCSKGDRTKQCFKDECDINKMMARYNKSGVFPMPTSEYKYGDFAAVPDYQSALNIVISAQRSFDSLSLEVRKRFDYDPVQFLQFVNDPVNYQEGVKLGIWNKAAEPPKVDPKIEPGKSNEPLPGTGGV